MNTQRKPLSRRHFLKGMGASIALPMLGAMTPTIGRAAFAAAQSTPRFVAICGGLGFHASYLFPDTPGRDYKSTPYLDQLKDHRDSLTLFSGLSHPDNNSGHQSELSWLTSAPRPGRPGFKNSISLDQLMAKHLSGSTRVPYLSLSGGGTSLSWTAGGVSIPAERSPAKVFQKLFINGTKQEVAAQTKELQRGKSILDTVLSEAKKLDSTLGAADKRKLDEYFSAVRELERELGQSEQWIKKPKPDAGIEPVTDITDKQDIVARQRLMYDLIVLALQTDSTRVATYALGSLNSPPSNIPGVSNDWHALSHHGKDETKLSELKLIEEAEFAEFNRFLDKLKSRKEQGRPLLDTTAVLFGSNLGNASSHNCTNLPILLAGGAFKHGAYIAHDPKNNTPLSNLFVSLAQHMGIETDSFGSSTAAGITELG